MKDVLDVCCGSRMFWFDRGNPRVVFCDIRHESHEMKDKTVNGGIRYLHIAPNVVCDFRRLPFTDEQFSTVVFDPPHLVRAGINGWQAKKYGRLESEWQGLLRAGFNECWRVLRPTGTMIFKWHEYSIPVSSVVNLAPAPPMLGQRCGKTAKTHWMVFVK